MSDNLFKTENVIAIVLAIIVVIIFTIPYIFILFFSRNVNPRLINAQSSLFSNAETFEPSSSSNNQPILIVPSPPRRIPPTGVPQTPRPTLIILNKIKKNRRSKA